MGLCCIQFMTERRRRAQTFAHSLRAPPEEFLRSEWTSHIALHVNAECLNIPRKHPKLVFRSEVLSICEVRFLRNCLE